MSQSHDWSVVQHLNHCPELDKICIVRSEVFLLLLLLLNRLIGSLTALITGNWSGDKIPKIGASFFWSKVCENYRKKCFFLGIKFLNRVVKEMRIFQGSEKGYLLLVSLNCERKDVFRTGLGKWHPEPLCNYQITDFKWVKQENRVSRPPFASEWRQEQIKEQIFFVQWLNRHP